MTETQAIETELIATVQKRDEAFSQWEKLTDRVAELRLALVTEKLKQNFNEPKSRRN